ncbi:methyltransferase (plasmid) [Rickettsiales bacterium Ac37b]|nr:methyltransferase [Rickettsiales bacterium Ac37b]
MPFMHGTQEYLLSNLTTARDFFNWPSLLKFDLSMAHKPGLNLEFGTAGGSSINYLAQQEPYSIFHGFDSFYGLPEAWYCWPAGYFSLNGNLPAVEKNVKLHKGFFNETLPQFLELYKDNVRFLHLDADLYSSTKYVLDKLADRIQPGTVIAFDEYWNYPGWKEHEYKAFQEFVGENYVVYHYIGYASETNLQVSVMIDHIGQPSKLEVALLV